MNYKKISPNTWKDIDIPGETDPGYKCVIIDNSLENGTGLFLFRDEEGNSHFALDISHSGLKVIQDPNVNGLSLKVNKFNLLGVGVKSFIDISCSIDGFLDEFSEVVKEICVEIVESRKKPYDAVIQVVTNWKVFWGKKYINLLSPDEQVGLICEIIILESLCLINPENALKSWVGPLGAVHDYTFSDWALEIKGTQQPGPKHKINGINQLKPPLGKKLAFVSFSLTKSFSERSFSLPDLIERISKEILAEKTEQLIVFLNLLEKAGYTPNHKRHYQDFKIEIIDSNLFLVDENFPCITDDFLIKPLSPRVTSVSYSISLEGLDGLNLNELNWGNYFY